MTSKTLFLLCTSVMAASLAQAPRPSDDVSLAALASESLGIGFARADDDWRDLHQEVREGRLVALPTLLDWLDERYDGQVLEVELERDDGRILYEIELVGAQGQVVEFEFDAGSGELLSIEGVGIDAMQRPSPQNTD